ncbi:MAG: DUF1700 domain-containing protein [Bdellovibrionales bacterium]|nr:DUF1700 domain-containing protein [Bdellovibrionales bacterium]
MSSKTEFLQILGQHLARLPESERADILRDQEEFFRDALASGRTEADVIGSLGDPKQLAKTLIAEAKLTGAETSSNSSLRTQMGTTMRAVIAIVTLAPFNLIFVLGPFLGLLGCLVAGWAVGASFLIAGGAAVFFLVTELVPLSASTFAHIASFLLSLGVVMFSFSFLALMAWVSSWVASLTVRYLRWNLDLIQARA